MKETFIYMIRPARPGFLTAMTPQEEELVGAHFHYLKNAFEQGNLILAGPCLDKVFGIAVFRAENMVEAEKFMNDDPAIKGGAFTSERFARHF
jgi:uncharacterized protein